MRLIGALIVVLAIGAVALAEVTPRRFFFHHSATPVLIPGGGSTNFFLDETAPTGDPPLAEQRTVNDGGSESFPTFSAGPFAAETRLAPIASTILNLSAGQHGKKCLDIGVDVAQLHAGGGMTSLGRGTLNQSTLPRAAAGGTVGFETFRLEFTRAGSGVIPAGDSVAITLSVGNGCRTSRDVFLAYDGSLAQSRLAFNCCFTVAAKCGAAKINAAGRKAACLLGLEATEASRGSAKDPAKVAACRAKLQETFAKSEQKGGCITTGDASAIEARVDAFSNDVDDALSGPVDPPATASRCDGNKLKAAGKRAKCALQVRAKAVGKATFPDPAKLQQCADKMAAAFTKAQGSGGCTATGDAGAIGDVINAFVDDVVNALECKCASPSGAFLDAATGAGY